jgi:hypothetical protein
MKSIKKAALLGPLGVSGTESKLFTFVFLILNLGPDVLGQNFQILHALPYTSAGCLILLVVKLVEVAFK